MSTARIVLLVLVIGCCSACSSVQGQDNPSQTTGNSTATGPTVFSNDASGINGQVAIVPDNSDIVSGYENQGGSQMHFRLTRAYCDKRTNSQQSASDQANFYCGPDAVTIDDTHPPSTTPNKSFLIVPYADGMNMEYPAGLEINSKWLGAHANHTSCQTSPPVFWLDHTQSCDAGGQIWAEDNTDAGGVFLSAYDVAVNGSIDRSQSFTMIASDTYPHASHGDMLFVLRDPNDNFRFQFGASGHEGADGPTSYKEYTRARIDSTGKGFFDGGTQVGGADFAESVDASGSKTNYEPGDVLVINTASNRQFSLSTSAYSTLVAGIYSTKPGVVGALRTSQDPKLTSEIPMAMVGIVPCKVSDENGPISRGDLLVASSTPGYAMHGTDKTRLPGAVLGKALQPLVTGRERSKY